MSVYLGVNAVSAVSVIHQSITDTCELSITDEYLLHQCVRPHHHQVVWMFYIETVKDLIRFLRHDSFECDIRRQLGEAEIVSTDLLPIIKQYHDDRILFDTVIR